MERRRARLEALAQVTAHDYELALSFGPKAKNGEDAIHVEDPEQTLARLGGGLNDEHVLRYQKGMTLIEVAHKIQGTFRWAGRAALANRERPGLFHIWHTLEDARCENRLAESLPGTKKNFRAFILPAIEAAERNQMSGQLPLFLQIQWGLYLAGIGQTPGVPSSRPGDLPAAWFDSAVVQIFHRLIPLIDRACAAEDPKTAFDCANEIYDAIQRYFTEEQLSRMNEDQDLSEIPEEILQKIESQNLEGEDDEPLEMLHPEAAEEIDEDDVGEQVELSPEELAALGHWAAPWFELEGNKKEIHPTADYPDERTIVLPPEGKAEEYAAVIDNAGSQIKVLVWKLMQIIQERTYTRFSGSHRSGKLNLPKLWKQRLGKFHLFHRKEEPDKLDVCFTLLVDESGSMNRESKYMAAREATIFFAEALDRLDVPFEVIGYSTESSEAAMAAALGHIPAFKFRHIRHSPLQHRIYKGFEDQFAQVKNRLVNIYPRFNNWDEEHLLFAYRRLIQRPEEEKIIIITSDGQPNGDASHLVNTVNRLQKLGVRVIGVGVVDPFVEQIYPNHIVVKDLSQLSTELVNILRRELIGGVESHTW